MSILKVKFSNWYFIAKFVRLIQCDSLTICSM